MSAGHGETAIPPKFDPYIQSFNLTRNDGTTFVTDMATLDYLRTYGTRLAINYGSQIGASIVLLLVLFVLTRAEKRKSGIFIMNSICLFVNMCRAIVQALWLTGNWFNPYAFISFDSSHITKGDIANSVAANVLTMILYIGVMISLSLQVWVVCITTPKLQRFLIMGSTTLIALIACGYRFAITVISAEQTVAMNPEGMEPYQGLLTTTTILTTTAIWTYCAVFTFKLGFALIQRRKLGMAQFGPMQIIFIMGCQTMVIPAIFSALQFYTRVPELGSLTPTVVTLFLPLSAIWAGVIANDTSIGSSGADAHQRLLRDQFGSTGRSGSTGGKSNLGKHNSIGSTFEGKELDSPTDLQELRPKDDAIRVQIDREWNVGVEKGEASNAY